MKPITALLILDGFGYSTDPKYNAILTDGAKNIRALCNKYPHTLLQASGLDVGLPDGQMGNSEVGHLNIGAGRIVYQELTRITESVRDGSFFTNPAFMGAIENCKKHDSALHLMGLCSDGGVHSHLRHLYALVELAKRNGIAKVYIHCFMDGRDVPPSSGKGYIQQVNAELSKLGCGKIATVMGRYYAMDRDNRFERVVRAYDALTFGEGLTADTAEDAMQLAYDRGETDEFVQPTVVTEGGLPVGMIQENDSIIFFNYRPDRAREISRAYIMEDFSGFERKKGYFPLYYASMTQYDASFEGLLHVAFNPQSLENTLGEYLAKKNIPQLRIAETEKYAHVTFFFNGGVEAPNALEDRVLIPSPKVPTYDMQPEMSAYEVTEEAIKRINSGKYEVMILNFANPDMVGHTGVMDAATKAVHTVDICAKKVVDAILNQGGSCIITADHGNCERMWDEHENAPFTAHTTNPVPCIMVSDTIEGKLRDGGRLCDLAPTLLDMMNVEIPVQMSGKTLLVK
ncbi:MAG: 2,3-bisphosphoglycerate-independent phosphoglycerate mutase [Eubacteriales bacterium]|nr:2,3-bisphosphoglycerate-independent phosphoglycerate mutase [Eubacteriales bacterium]